MTGVIFGLVFLWVFSVIVAITGGAMCLDDTDGGGFVAWLGGVIFMGAIWQSWVLYKFYILPLGL